MDVFSLAAKLTLDSSDYDKGLSDAENKASSFGSKLGTAFKVGGAAIAAVTTATTALTGALIKGTGDVAAYGDNIDKMSQKMGLSAEAYQEWDAVMQHSGTSMESLQAGMKTLANAVENGNEAFGRLGITESQIARMSNEELFSATITALQNVENETERTYLAGQLLGRGATELGALLNTSAEDTQAMKDRVHELGGVMSDEAVKSAAAFQDSLQDMTTAFSGLKRNLLSEFMPSITTVMDGLGNLFSGNGGLEQISEGIDAFTDKLTEMMPKILEVGSEILLSLSSAIVANLPQLVDAATQATITLVNGLIEQAPMLVTAAMEILFALSNALIDNLPQLIPAIAKVIVQIVEALTEPETLQQLVEAAVKLTLAVAQGLIEALPYILMALAKLLENILTAIGKWEYDLYLKGKEIVQHIANGIAEAIHQAANWGRDLIDNFVQGIKDRIQHVIDTVRQLAQTVKDYLGFSEPKKGPLSNFHTFAPDMVELFAKGIRDNERLIADQFSQSLDFGAQAVPFSTSSNGASGFNTTVDSGDQKPINITLTLDGATLARVMWDYNKREGQLRGGALA